MTRDEWRRRVWNAVFPEACSTCGRPILPYHLTDDGDLLAYCGWCEREYVAERVPVPASFDREEATTLDLPF